MTCPICKRPTTPLFLSTACDHCDYGPLPEKLYRAFVVWTVGASCEEYVFQTQLDAEQWRGFSGRASAEIREVFGLQPFNVAHVARMLAERGAGRSHV